jgi:Pol polyprotein
MAPSNPDRSTALPNNNNYADGVLSGHFATTGIAIARTPPGSDEDLRPVLDLRARNMTISPVGSQSRFILSSRAACHISPERSDFKTLTQIDPHPVDLDDTRVYAMGRGTIDIHTDIAGRKVTLQNVLFVPFATARLISISSLCGDGYSCHYSKNSCRIVDEDGNTVAHGVESRSDFFLSPGAFPVGGEA